ncbi:LysE family translocator [Saccharothrix sp. NRRL B-16314]|uniref:LysE family translocator n=1 Tax=Saccharothrix sp. NRRL B-16314 TaxID=1463825 RepID=UPI000525120C|nr:LysE family transporter [Saccharothrix sp. NRRL B-16314]
MDALGLGLTLGLAAGISPGPLLVLVVTSALRSGRRAGVLTACAPLLSDAVVVAVTLLLLDRLPGRALGVLGVVGAVFVVWSGAQTVREARSAALPTDATHPTLETTTETTTETGALKRAVVVNLLSPHPWIAWATALGPLIVTTWRESAGAGAALLIGFYATLVGGKIVIALLVARGRSRLRHNGYRRALTCAGVLLVLVGITMGVEFAGHLRTD